MPHSSNKHSVLAALLLTFLSFTSAAAINCRGSTLSAGDILKVAPDAESCASTPYPAECATASQAASPISASFDTQKISSFGAQAALLSLMLYETGSFKYNINHYPGVPGQGTRNMQSPAFNLKYANWLATNMPSSGITAAAVNTANAQGPAAVLALVGGNELSFGSAAWFLRTQCDSSVEDGLATGTEASWNNYLTTCVVTTATEDRTAIWRKAIALGHWST